MEPNNVAYGTHSLHIYLTSEQMHSPFPHKAQAYWQQEHSLVVKFSSCQNVFKTGQWSWIKIEHSRGRTARQCHHGLSRGLQ